MTECNVANRTENKDQEMNEMKINVKTSPLKIQGIKTKSLPHIQQNISWDGNGRWIEPFLGSAVVLLNVDPCKAIAGDSNPHIVKFYKSIQEGTLNHKSVRMHLEREGDRLSRQGEECYYRIRSRFNQDADPHDFLFLNRSCFNGLIRFNKSGGFNTPFCRKPERFRNAYVTKICNQVKWAEEKIRGKNWEFVCSDWRNLLSDANSNDFVYVDPPYVGRYTDYFNSWSDDDASKLEKALKSLPCRFLYSMWSENKYRRNDRLYDQFSDYEITTFSHFYHLGSSETLRNSIIEALVVG